MSNYLRKIILTTVAVVVGLGFAGGAFAQGKGKGGGHGNGNGHGNGGGNPGGGGWAQSGGGGGNGNGGQGGGNGWGRIKQENRGGGGGFVQQARPQQVYRQPQQVYRQPQQVYRQPQQVYRQPQQVYRQPQQVYQPQVWSNQNWKQERRAQKWREHSEEDRGRGFFNPRPMENFIRQQQRREDKEARKQQREFEKSWRRTAVAQLAFDQRVWRRDDEDDRSERYRDHRQYYSQPYQQQYPQQYYQPYTYRQYYQPEVYQPYSYQYPTTQYYYQQSPYYGYNSYYPGYYSGGSRKEMIIRSIISSVFGGSPLAGLGGFSGLYGNDPYYADSGYYYYNGYYYNQPVYDFYQQTACYPTAYLSDYSPVYYSGPTYYSDYYPTYTTGYYPSYYSTYYSPVSYYDYNDYGNPYSYAGYGYGDSLLSLIPGGSKLDRATGGIASQILIAALGGAYGRGYDDALYYDEYGYGSRYTTAAYVPASLPSSLRTSEARQIFDQGYELGYRDALARRDPYGRLDLVSSFLGQTIGL